MRCVRLHSWWKCRVKQKNWEWDGGVCCLFHLLFRLVFRSPPHDGLMFGYLPKQPTGQTVPDFWLLAFRHHEQILEWQKHFHTLTFIPLPLNHGPWKFGYSWVCWSGTKLDFPAPGERNTAERKHSRTWARSKSISAWIQTQTGYFVCFTKAIFSQQIQNSDLFLHQFTLSQISDQPVKC